MKNLLLALALTFVGTAFTQIYQHEQKLIEFLGQNRYDNLASKNSKYLDFLDARCAYGYELIEYADEKMNDFQKITSVQLTNVDKTTTVIDCNQLVQSIQNGSFNILRLKLEYDRNSPTYYTLGNTGKVLMLHPTDHINKKMNL